MRSPAEGPDRRVAVEWVLRAVAAALLVWAMLQSVGSAASHPDERANAASLPEALVRWSTVAAPLAVTVRLGSLPAAASRDWLGALRGAGTRAAWKAGVILPIALAATPVADPAGVIRLDLAAPPGTVVALRDAVGVVDTVRVGATGGAAVTAREAPGTLAAAAGTTAATAAAPAPIALRRVLVLGQVGWESRFVVDALEERGWRVDTRLSIAPHTDMRQGVSGPPDTSRYAAVVVTDSIGPAEMSRVSAYVRSGGGLVVAGSASGMAAARDILAGVPGGVLPAAAMEPRNTTMEAAKSRLDLLPIERLRPDAIPLEIRDQIVAVAARRVGAGRLVQSGYLDTWRWRMAAASGEEAHRDWWASLLRDVAYAPVTAPPGAGRDADNVPVAAAIDALGPMAASLPASPGSSDSLSPVWIFAGIVLALLTEWTSRRLRGAI